MTTRHIALLMALSCFPFVAVAQDADRSDKAQADKNAPDKLPTIASRVDKLQKIDGFMPLYWQASSGKLLMEVGRFNQELLYQISLPAGLGSNPVGLDRGQMGQTRIVRFERIGPKVLLIEPNYRYRALTNNVNEQRAV